MSTLEPAHALNLSLPQQLSFIRFYNGLSEKSPSTVRFFNRVDYYTVHGDDSNLIAEITSGVVKYMGDKPKLSYTVLNKSLFEKVIRELLLVRQYRVEVYVKASQSKNNDWSLEYKGSPGNLSQFEEILFENTEIAYTNIVMAVKVVKGKMLAVGTINITEAKIELCELVDNDCFTELEAIIAQVTPKECVIPAGDSPDLISLKKLLERNGVLIAKLKKTDFTSEDIIQDLNRLLFFHEGLTRNTETLPEIKLTEALSCLQALIKFLNLTGDDRNFNQFKINQMDIHRFVRLDNAALYALNILPEPSIDQMESNFSKKFSLLGVLDHCCTVQGKRLLEQWIKQPLKDYNLINERLEIVQCLVKDSETRQILSGDSLTRLPDMMLLSRKFLSKKATLQDCYKVYQMVGSLPVILKTLQRPNNKCITSMLIEPISEILSDMDKYQGMIEEILDLDLIERGEFFVKKDYNENLEDLYKKKQRIEEKMLKLLHLASEDLGFEEGKTIKLECTDQHGYFFRVTLKEEKVLRQNRQYHIIDVIKGGVRFRNNALTELNEKYADLKEQYENEQKEVVQEVFEVAAGYADSLRNLNMYIATIDVLVSFAVASISARIPYIRPKMHEIGSKSLKLVQARHPCLENRGTITFIPNDVEFNKDVKTLHIITGPNMCGKSTYIRSVGCIVVMAHIGCLVPCDNADIPIVDGILARIGAEDCQLKGLSTFMLEMVETSTIIKSATSNSLVIIDELGRGTSTYDGCGIGWAVAEHLATKVKCFSLFATHFHEISLLEEKLECVSNLHVTALSTENTITPLYQIRQGPCDKSYGIHCARMVGFPEDVIEGAINHQKKLENQEGMKNIKDFEPSIKTKVIEEGDKTIEDTLKKIKETDTSKMSDQELLSYFKNLQIELDKDGNLFIKGLLSD